VSLQIDQRAQIAALGLGGIVHRHDNSHTGGSVLDFFDQIGNMDWHEQKWCIATGKLAAQIVA
jgi:hypothetical protein